MFLVVFFWELNQWREITPRGFVAPKKDKSNFLPPSWDGNLRCPESKNLWVKATFLGDDCVRRILNLDDTELFLLSLHVHRCTCGTLSRQSAVHLRTILWAFGSFFSFLTCALQCFQQKRNKRVQSLLNRYLRPMSKLFPLSKDPGELGWGFKTADCAWLLTSPDRVVKPAILTCIRSLLKVANREFHTRFSSLLYHCSTMFNIFLSMARPLKPW